MIGSEVAHSQYGPFLREDYNFFELLDAEVNPTRFYSVLLYAIARTHGVKTIVEIGVGRGVTTSFLARAAQLNDGKVFGIEISSDQFSKHRPTSSIAA